MTAPAKPMGPIPPGFAVIDGELAIAGVRARDWVARAGGAPLFVYDAGLIAPRIAAFRAALPGVALHYAVKANPFAPLLQWIASQVDGFDIASGGELAAVQAAGVAGPAIGFAGPGKRNADLLAALHAGVVVHLESAGEADRLFDLAAQSGITPRVAIRINPDFELAGAGMRMGGGARPFGVDADQVPQLARRVIAAGADWCGFHLYAGSQSLDAAAIVAAAGASLALVARLADQAGIAVPACNLGGGFGIPYHAGQAPLDLAAVGEGISAALAGRATVLRDTRFTIELGRWLVGEAGVYLAEVIERKHSRGETFVVIDGGMHHQLAASGNFGSVIRRNFPCAVATRMDQPASEIAHVAGCLCTPLDRLGDALALPRAEPGDLIALFCAGAYGASASPAAFLGHGPAREVLAGAV